MHPRVDEFRRKALERHGLELDVRELPAGTRTAEDAAVAVGADVGQIVKSMVMMADDDLIVVLTAGPNRVSEGKLEEVFDADSTRTATPDEVKAMLGWSIGGVPPFCHDIEVPRLFDGTLLSHGVVWAGAGTPNAVFRIESDRLRRVCDARVEDVFE